MKFYNFQEINEKLSNVLIWKNSKLTNLIVPWFKRKQGHDKKGNTQVPSKCEINPANLSKFQPIQNLRQNE
jgi:hypothetical protein